MNSAPFTPGVTKSLVSTSTTGSTALPEEGSQQVLVTAATASVIIFVAFGDSAVAATTNASFPLLGGTSRIFTVGPNATHVAAISASTATAYITTGRGF